MSKQTPRNKKEHCTTSIAVPVLCEVTLPRHYPSEVIYLLLSPLHVFATLEPRFPVDHHTPRNLTTALQAKIYSLPLLI
jgi:hypothetical protein